MLPQFVSSPPGEQDIGKRDHAHGLRQGGVVKVDAAWPVRSRQHAQGEEKEQGGDAKTIRYFAG